MIVMRMVVMLTMKKMVFKTTFCKDLGTHYVSSLLAVNLSVLWKVPCCCCHSSLEKNFVVKT